MDSGKVPYLTYITRGTRTPYRMMIYSMYLTGVPILRYCTLVVGNRCP